MQNVFIPQPPSNIRESKKNDSATSQSPLDPAACWTLVERIAASSQLKRATRLRDLLLFVGRRQLKEGCDHLHEQEIGIEVFGRTDGYDTNLDNIVRSNFSELRKRIEAYFDADGRAENLLLEIPRGSYSLVFKKREINQPFEAEVPSPFSNPRREEVGAVTIDVGTVKRAILNRLLAATAIVAIVALSAACVGLWVQNRTLQRSLNLTDRSFYSWRYEPTVASFWKVFLDSRIDTDVVVPDAALSQYEYYTRTSVSLRDYVNRSYVGQLQAQMLSPDMRAIFNSFTSLNFVTLSAIKMAHSILALDPLNQRMHLYFSREYIPSFIERDNVILIGDQVSNPYIQLIENRLNFSVDRVGNHLGPVINRSAAQGEPATYFASDSIGYCVVAYLPNPGHNGKFLLIQGSSPAATQAAEFFLLSESRLSAFKQQLHTKDFPYFEVLLKTSQVTGTPLTATVEAYRVYSEQ